MCTNSAEREETSAIADKYRRLFNALTCELIRHIVETGIVPAITDKGKSIGTVRA